MSRGDFGQVPKHVAKLRYYLLPVPPRHRQGSHPQRGVGEGPGEGGSAEDCEAAVGLSLAVLVGAGLGATA